MRRASRPRRLGAHQVTALRRMLLTRDLQAMPALGAHARPVEVWRGLRRKRLVEKNGPWVRLTEAGYEAVRQLAGEAAELRREAAEPVAGAEP